MSKRTTESMGKSSPATGGLAEREHQVLEEEVTEFFGRAKSARNKIRPGS